MKDTQGRKLTGYSRFKPLQEELIKLQAENTQLKALNGELVQALKNLHWACMMDSDIPTAWWAKHKETVAKAKEAITQV